MKLLEDIYFGNLAPNEIEIEKGSEMDIQLKKIIKCEEGFVDIEYKLSNDVEIEQIPAMMMALAVSPDSEEAEASQEEEEDET